MLVFPAMTALSPHIALDTDLVSNCLKAAGDNLRLLIIRILAHDAFGVLELCHIFESKQSGMSHHLKVLAKAGLVSTRREGNSIFYRRNCQSEYAVLSDLRAAIYAAADTLSLNEKQNENLQDVYSQRSATSHNFFHNHAGAFKEQQELIAAYDIYGPEVAQLLQDSQTQTRDCALEIGPGTGEFLPELSDIYKQVIALDTSEEMLNQSREYCTRRAIDNIKFVHNDTRHLATLDQSLDCIILNMVLHHTPSPIQIFEHIAKALKTGGIFITCELCAHDQDWVREACGDQWLGFEANDLKHWASINSLDTTASRFLALRNGFQIQLHRFTKRTNSSSNN